MLIAAGSPAADVPALVSAHVALTGAVTVDIAHDTDFAALAQRIGDLDPVHDQVVVHGRPGLVTRYRDDDPWTLVDLAGSLRCPVVVAVTVDEWDWTALALARLADDGLDCPGIVITTWPEAPDHTQRYGAARLAALAPLLGVLPAGTVAGRLRRAALVPLFGGTFDAARFLARG